MKQLIVHQSGQYKVSKGENIYLRWRPGKILDANEDLLLQKRFWSIFEDRIKRLNLRTIHDIRLMPQSRPMLEKIKLRYGAKFLRENQNWIR